MSIPEPSTTPGKLVLVIEDHTDSREVIAAALRVEGYEVATASDGAAAFLQLEQGLRPVLIVLDLALPGTDAFAFRAAQLRKPELAAIPTVIYSARHVSSVRAAAAALQIDAFVLKPDVGALIEEVASRSCRPSSPAGESTVAVAPDNPSVSPTPTPRRRPRS